MDRITGFTSARVSDHWERQQHGELLIVQKAPGGPRTMFYLCPCGCESPISVPDHGHVAWTITQEADGTWSASPSVRMTDPAGCQSHYFIKSNTIQWC